MEAKRKSGIGFFEKYLSVWVILCMGIGTMIGKYASAIPDFLN